MFFLQYITILLHILLKYTDVIVGNVIRTMSRSQGLTQKSKIQNEFFLEIRVFWIGPFLSNMYFVLIIFSLSSQVLFSTFPYTLLPNRLYKALQRKRLVVSEEWKICSSRVSFYSVFNYLICQNVICDLEKRETLLPSISWERRFSPGAVWLCVVSGAE